MQAVSPQEEESLRRDWVKLTWAIALFSFGFAIYNGVFQNFLKDHFNATALDLGRLEALREVPGLLTSLTAGLLVALAESRAAALGLAVCGVGIGLTTTPQAYWPLVGITMFWSVGFHLYASMSSAITLNLAKGREGGRHLGRQGAIGAVATIAALALSWLVSRAFPNAPYIVFFGLGGISILGAAVCLGLLSHHSASQARQPIVFRKEYGLFYLLTFLEGCRRQIFSIFAQYSLIQAFHVGRQDILLLLLVNSVLIAVTAAPMGRLMDKVGERIPLTWYAILLILVFTGYAAIPRDYALVVNGHTWLTAKHLLFGLFIVDNVLFSFSVGFTTYLNRIVRPGERTPCVAMGVTMNHVAAVTVPVIGAVMWTSTGDYHLPFMLGVAVAVVALGATMLLPSGRFVAPEELPQTS